MCGYEAAACTAPNAGVPKDTPRSFFTPLLKGRLLAWLFAGAKLESEDRLSAPDPSFERLEAARRRLDASVERSGQAV